MPIIILCGDFYQFSPLLGDSLLFPGRPTEHWQRTGEKFVYNKDDQYVGHQLWLKFTAAVLLDEQMRTVDPQLGLLLQRLRHNEQTMEDVQLLNSRVAQLHGER